MYKLNINLFNKLINVNVELKHNVLYTEKQTKKKKQIKYAENIYMEFEKCQNSLI